MKTILVPTDFSDQANNAVKLAAEIAKKSDAKVILLNVIEGTRSFSFNTMGEVTGPTGEEEFYVKKLIDVQKERLERASNNDVLSGLDVETALELGNPYEGISNVIADRAADLLVMGTKGASGLDEVLIGSNTEKVVRYAKCPVITVKEEVSIEKIKHIVFATNLTDDQSRLVDSIKKISDMTGADVHLLKVNTPNHFFTQRQLEEEFKKFAKKYDLESAATHVYNEATEEDGILYFAEDLGNCMVAMGTHGRTGLLHLLSGSIAEDLVNHANMPVMTVSMKK